MIEQLFGSKTRIKLLKMFYSNPNRSFYVREITRKIDEQINSVRRELSNLLSIGIIGSDTTNNRLYYEVNQKYEFYQPLAQIFGGGAGLKTAKGTTEEPNINNLQEAVAADPVVVDYQGLGNVELVIYSGQFTRDKTSGIDILIVGDVNHVKLNKFMAELENKEAKELSYAVMTPDEFKYRTQVNDRFLMTLMNAKKQILIDKHNVITEE